MKANYAKNGCTVFGLIGVLLFLHSDIGYTNSQQEEDRAQEYIRQLKSEDESVRATAKNNLIQLGSKAVKPLIAFLEELINNPNPVYTPGKEKEGEQISEELKEELKKLPLQSGKLTPETIKRLGDQLMKVSIGGRLKYDVCQLLGEIHSAETVPILISFMLQQEPDDLFVKFNPEMRALAKIGSPAVPALIQSIEEAEKRITAEKEKTSQLSLDDKQIQEFNIYENRYNQLRAVRVLGEIGDARALPVLENLLSKDDDKYFQTLIKEAIEKIKK
jgi:HEAT repeat protein